MIWYVEENKRKYPTVIPFHRILLSGMFEETFKIDELLCRFDMKVLVCKAIKNVQVLVAKSDDALGVTRWALGVTRWALGLTRWALHVICQSAGKKIGVD